jgi:hypothetical protein
VIEYQVLHKSLYKNINFMFAFDHYDVRGAVERPCDEQTELLKIFHWDAQQDAYPMRPAGQYRASRRMGIAQSN